MSTEKKSQAERWGLPEGTVYWNEQGRVVCSNCSLPYPGSDSWRMERWQKVTPQIVKEARAQGWEMACEDCGHKPSGIVMVTA